MNIFILEYLTAILKSYVCYVSSVLLHWQLRNREISPAPVKQPWSILINELRKSSSCDRQHKLHFAKSRRWGHNEMAVILQKTFSSVFSWTKLLNFKIKFHWKCSVSSTWQYISTGSDNGLARSRRQAIIWYNDDPVHRRLSVSPDLNELTRFYMLERCSSNIQLDEPLMYWNYSSVSMILPLNCFDKYGTMDYVTCNDEALEYMYH